MAIQINFNNVPEEHKSSGFTLVPEGVYKAAVFASSEEKTKKGDPKLSIRWKIEGSGDIVWDDFYLGPKSLWKIRDLHKAIGLPSVGAMEVEPDNYVGAKAIIKVFHEEYNGKTYAKVKTYTSAGNAPQESVTPAGSNDVEFQEDSKVEYTVTEGARAMLETLDNTPEEIAVALDVTSIGIPEIKKFLKLG